MDAKDAYIRKPKSVFKKILMQEKRKICTRGDCNVVL